MVEYDATHVTGRLTTQEIAEAIRHKKYGVDMRETLAQGFECMFNWYETLHELQGTVENLNARVETLEENVSNLSEDITDLRQQHEKDVDALAKRINELNETIEKQDARISKLEGAVFGLAPADITTPPTPDYPNSGMVEVNFDDRKDKKDKW